MSAVITHGLQLSVVAMAARLPEAESAVGMIDNLRRKRDSTRLLTQRRRLDSGQGPEQVDRLAYLDDVDLFARKRFGISLGEAAHMDPQHRIVLECVAEALAQVPWLYDAPQGCIATVFANPKSRFHALTLGRHPTWKIGSSSAVLAGRVSRTFDLRGPTVSLEAACASSLYAVHYAASLLEHREVNAVVLGGVNIYMPLPKHAELVPGIHSTTGVCRPFDDQADGIVQGEGCVVMVLCRREDLGTDGESLGDILAVGVNHNGSRGAGLNVPSARSQIELLGSTWRAGGVAPSDIGYIEGHGTGTRLGDAIELRSFHSLMAGRRDPCRVGSIKGNIGHLDSAAGLAGLAKAVFSVRMGRIFPTANHTLPPTELLEWNPNAVSIPVTEELWQSASRVAGVTCLGLSGSNAHLVVASDGAPWDSWPKPVLAEMERERCWPEREMQREVTVTPQRGPPEVAAFLRRELGRDVLGSKEPLGRLGLDSLGATEIVSILDEALGTRLQPHEVIEMSPSELLSSSSWDKRKERPVRLHSAPPELPALEGIARELWAFQEADPQSVALLLPQVVEVSERLAPEFLLGAVADVEAEHPLLRSRIDVLSGGIRFADSGQAVPVAVVQVDEAAAKDTLQSCVEQLMEPFALRDGPMMRMCLLLAPDRSWVISVAHHVAMDGSSWRSFWLRLFAAYDCRSEASASHA